MKNKILTLLIFSIFLISLTSITALDSLGTFKQNSNIRISQICNDATYITISSITYPDSAIATTVINMTYVTAGEFYYNFANSQQIGRYDVRGISDGCENTFATYFIVGGDLMMEELLGMDKLMK